MHSATHSSPCSECQSLVSNKPVNLQVSKVHADISISLEDDLSGEIFWFQLSNQIMINVIDSPMCSSSHQII